MQIFYSPESDPMIAASRLELRLIAVELERFLASDQNELFILANTNLSADPYQTLLSGLKLTKNQEPIYISLEADGCLKVEGAAPFLTIWAQAFHFSETAMDGDHHHPESQAGMCSQSASLSTIVEVYEPE